MDTKLKSIALAALRSTPFAQSYSDAVVWSETGGIIAMCAGEVVRNAWNDARFKRNIPFLDVPSFRSNLGRAFMWFNDRHQMTFAQIADLIEADQFPMVILDDQELEALKARFPLPDNAPPPPTYSPLAQLLEEYANGMVTTEDALYAHA